MMGGGGGGGGGSSRNDIGLADRGLEGIPWPVSDAGLMTSGFIPGTTPGSDPFGINPSGTPNLPGTSAGAYNTAVGGTGALANLGLGMLGSNLPGSDMSMYMNPFQQNVIDTTMGELNRQKGFAENAIGDSALSASAFGGSRHGVRESMLDRQYGDIQEQSLARLNSQNFNNAQGMQQFFAGLGGNMAGSGFSNLGQLGNMGFGMSQNIIKDQMASGGMQQQLMQSLMDAAKGQFGGYSNAANQSLIMQSEIPQIGNAGTQTTTQETSANPLGSILGLFGALL